MTNPVLYSSWKEINILTKKPDYSAGNNEYNFPYFDIQAVLDIEVEKLIDDFKYRSEKWPEWNSRVQEVRVLKCIDKKTELAYMVSAPVLGGPISSGYTTYIPNQYRNS